jgi:hypothetical protein
MAVSMWYTPIECVLYILCSLYSVYLSKWQSSWQPEFQSECECEWVSVCVCVCVFAFLNHHAHQTAMHTRAHTRVQSWDLTSVKRDLIRVKRDLIRVKRDLIRVTRAYSHQGSEAHKCMHACLLFPNTVECVLYRTLTPQPGEPGSVLVHEGAGCHFRAFQAKTYSRRWNCFLSLNFFPCHHIFFVLIVYHHLLLLLLVFTYCY